PARDDPACLRVDALLAGDEHEAVGSDRLRVRADRGGGQGGLDALGLGAGSGLCHGRALLGFGGAILARCRGAESGSTDDGRGSACLVARIEVPYEWGLAKTSEGVGTACASSRSSWRSSPSPPPPRSPPRRRR